MTSISLLKFNVELGKLLGRPVRLSEVVDRSSARALSEYFGGQTERSTEMPKEQDTEESTVSEPTSNRPSTHDECVDRPSEDAPLTASQQGVFIEAGMDEHTVKYNIPVLFRLSDEIDLNRLKAALETAIKAHPQMQTELYSDANGDVRQRENKDATP